MGELIAFFFLILLSGMFSSAETSFTLLDKTRLRVQARKGDYKSRVLSRLWERPEYFFTPLLVGNNLVNITAAVILTSLLVRIWGGMGAFYSTIIGTLLLLYLGELLPKSLAARFPNTLSRIMFFPLFLIFILLYPISFLINSGIMLLKRVIPGLRTGETFFSREEIKALASGWGKTELSEILERALSFSAKTVGDIMVPRVDFRAFPGELPLAKVLEEAKDMRYSRYPIFEGSLDNIVGVLYLKDLLQSEVDYKIPCREKSRPPLFLIESLSLIQALEEMRGKRATLALVVDEYGGTSGLVTIEDILEEIVGEIWDEYDHPVSLLKEEKGKFIVDARISLEELSHRLKLSLKSEAVTLGGFLEEIAGKIPSPGEKFLVDGVLFEVMESSGKEVRKVQVHLQDNV